MASMSPAPHEDINKMEAIIGPGTGNYQYPPQSAQNQAPQGVSNFVDGSGPILSMYLEMASEADNKMAEGWKADADGILIFTGLFSAAVASLISVSIQDIRPNPQDTSNFYLANIYQTVSNPNPPNIPLPSSPSSPPPFSPPTYAVWVNSLWFLSLVISISCALLATLLQQWARRYLKANQLRYSPDKRARIRTFLSEGVDKLLLPWAVEALPTLLHVSLFLFFAGLVVFLWNVNITVFKLALSWVGVCTALYGCITIIPIIRYDSSYYTPLSLPVWKIVNGISFLTFRVLRKLTYSSHLTSDACFRFRDLEIRSHQLLVQGMQKAAENAALNAPSEIDTRAFLWTFDSLDEDHELERFFSGLPGIRNSKVVDDPLPGLTEVDKDKLSGALSGFFDRTFSSDLLPGPVKNRRAMICAKALDPLQFPDAFRRILLRVISLDQHSGLQATEFIRVMRGWRGGGDRGTELFGEAIFTCLIARVQCRDDSWLISAPNILGIPEADLRRYATDCSLSLTSLIYFTHRQFSQFEKPLWPRYEFRDVLVEASKFDVQDSSPNLQHEFCALWNQIVLKAQNDVDREMAGYILRPIRKVYIALHEGTDAAPTQFFASTNVWDDVLFDPSSYPRCDIVSHIHDSAPTTSAHSVLHDNDASLPAPLASPDVHSSSRSLPHVIESLTDIPFDDFHPQTAYQTNTESLSFPVTSPDPVTADTFVTPGGIISRSTSATSTSTPPLSSTSPPAAVTLQHNADRMAPFGPPNGPSSTSHPILDNTLPTVDTASSASIGNPMVGPRNENDAHDPPSVICSIHANATATLDTSPQPPSPSVTDMDPAIAGPSPREPNAERTRGGRPLQPFRCPYDIV